MQRPHARDAYTLRRYAAVRYVVSRRVHAVYACARIA